MASFRLKSAASKLYLSYLWWVIEPMLYVAVFYFVFSYLLANGRADFLPFLMCGKIPLMWFTKSLTKNASSIVVAKGLIGQRDFPKYVFPYAETLEVFYKEVVVFIFLLSFLWWFGFPPTTSWVYLGILLIVMFVVILSTGLLAAYITVFVPDFRMFIAMVALALLFVSGVFWDINSIPDPEVARMLMIANPFAFLIDAFRKVLMYGQRPDLTHLFYIFLVSLTLLLVMHGWLYLRSQAVARRLFS